MHINEHLKQPTQCTRYFKKHLEVRYGKGLYFDVIKDTKFFYFLIQYYFNITK